MDCKRIAKVILKHCIKAPVQYHSYGAMRLWRMMFPWRSSQGLLNSNDFLCTSSSEWVQHQDPCVSLSSFRVMGDLHPLSGKILCNDRTHDYCAIFPSSLGTLWSAVIRSSNLSAFDMWLFVRFVHGALVVLVRLQISQFGSLVKVRACDVFPTWTSGR